MLKTVLLAGLVALMVIGAALAQTPEDPLVVAVGQEWQASEVGRGHLAEAVQKLALAYSAALEKQKAVDAYWKAYVGLPHEQQESTR